MHAQPFFQRLELLLRRLKVQPRIMTRRPITWCAIISVLLFIAIITWTNYLSSNASTKIESIPLSNLPPRLVTSSVLQPQDPGRFSNDTDIKCVTAKLDKTLEFPFCIYNEEDDIYISRTILRGDYYERGYALRTVNFMKRHDDVTFLDIGANLGIYSLPVAHAGRHVVAVEPNWNTLRRLSKSAYLGRVSDNVDLLHCAIAESRSTTFMRYNPVNRGRAEMSNKASCDKDCVNMSVPVVTLNDILPLLRNKKVIVKVDVEGAERKVFTPSSADEFFRVIDVLVIQMEWSFYPMYFSKTLENRTLVDKFLNFFYSKDFAIYNAKTEQRLNSKWTEWPNDICIRKAEKTGHLYEP